MNYIFTSSVNLCDISNFINSFNKVYKDDNSTLLVIFTDDIKNYNRYTSENIKIEVINYNQNVQHINNQRFAEYFKYMVSNNLEDDDIIFVCDSRDILFTKDIFKTYKNKIHVYKDGLYNELKDRLCDTHYNFEINIYKQILLPKFNKIYKSMYKNIKNTCCAGTILGNKKDLLYHFEKMWNIMSLYNNKERGMNKPGINTFAHNYAILQHPELYNIIENGKDILTLGRIYEMIENNLIDYNIPSVIHMYDRFNETKEIFNV